MSVVSMTVAWSVGLSAFVPAGAALAAPCPELEAGDLFKVSGNAAVYMVDSTGKRRFFPTELQYKTWFANFSGITTIGQECVESYAAGGSVNFRPGSYLVKSLISPSVYAVGPNNTLHKLPDEATAMALYGSNWTSKIVHTNDVFMGGYVGGFGAPVAALTPHNGMLIKKAGETTVYYVWDGVLKMVDGTLPAQAVNDVHTVSAEVFGKVAMSTGSVTPSTIVSNPSQLSGGVVTPPSSNGTLTVGLAADTAGASTIAAGTVYNNMLKVTVSATNGDVKVKGVTVTRTGLTTNASVSGVSVWDSAGNRHGDVMSSFSSDNKVTIGFGTYPIVVAKGQTTSFTVAFNLATTATSGTVGASVASAADVQTDGTVSGSFPIVGNTMSLVSGGSVADVQLGSVSAGGLSDEPSSSTAGNLEIGQTQEIAKFKFIQNDGDSDIQVSKATFYVQGTAKDGDLKNFEVLSPDNTVLGRTEMMSDRYVTVNFDKPYTVPKSTNRVLTLRATVEDGSGNWFRIQVQNDYDVMVKDTSTGYFIGATSEGSTTSFSAVSSSAGYFKMKSGTVTVSKTSDTPSTAVSAGANDVVLARFNVKAVGEDLEIRKIGMKIATSSSYSTTKGLTGSVKLRVGNDILLTTSASDTTYTLYNSASTQYTLSQYLNLKSGETKVLEVLGSVPTTATSASSFVVSVGNMYAKRLSTLDFTDNIPGSTLTAANTVTVESTDVTLAKDSSLGNNTLAAGSSQVIGQYTIKAGSAEDVKLTNVSVSFLGNGTFDTPSMLQNLELWVGNEQYGSTVSTAATSSNSFLSNITIKKNEVKVIKLKALILSNASGVASSSIASYTFVGADTQNTDSDNSAVVGQDFTVGSANVVLSAASDNSTTNSILVPSATPVQVGKWKLEAQNEAVTLKKITFSVHHALGGYLSTTSSDYGTFFLYDSADMNNAVGQGQYIGGSGNGYVQFTGMNLTVPANTYKFLVVKSTVNASGVMTPGMMSYLAVRSTSSTNLELVSSSGGTLTGDQIDTLSTDAQLVGSTFGSSTVHLFHNTAPVITSVSLGSTLDVSSETPIFKFTVYNPGDREMRLGTTTVKVSASGLTGNNSTTGTIDGWKLFEANANGSKGALLTSTTTCSLGGYPGNLDTCWNSAATSSISVPFGTWGQNGTAMNNLTIQAGSSRTFIVTADTTEIFNGKTSGIVTVSPMLDGATGYNFGDAEWATGVIQYYYTPVNDTSEDGPFTASDSYDVVGSTLSRSL